jgi:transcriptional regulator with XRE-family HTH domain
MGELYNLRKKMGLTQQEFADIVGISQSSMARIETGERPLPNVFWPKVNSIKLRLDANKLESDGDLDAAVQNLKQELASQLEAEIKDLQTKRRILEIKLDIMRDEYLIVRNALLVVIPEKRIFSKTIEYKKTVDKIFEGLAVTFLMVCPERQQILELEILALTTAIDLRIQKREEFGY